MKYLSRSLGKSMPLSLMTSLSTRMVFDSGSCLLISAVTRPMSPSRPSVLRPAMTLKSGFLTKSSNLSLGSLSTGHE